MNRLPIEHLERLHYDPIYVDEVRILISDYEPSTRTAWIHFDCDEISRPLRTLSKSGIVIDEVMDRGDIDVLFAGVANKRVERLADLLGFKKFARVGKMRYMFTKKQ